MTPSKWKALPTLPRVLGALYALFIGMFALDALGAGDFWTSAGAFGIHLIPAAFLVGVLAVAWFNELAGGVIYVVLGLAYVLATSGRMAPSVYVMISGVLLTLGTLFLASWVAQRRSDKGGLAPR